MTDTLKTMRTAHGEARLGGFSAGSVWIWYSDPHEGLPLVEVSMAPAGGISWVNAVKLNGKPMSTEIYDIEGSAFTQWCRRVEIWDCAVAGMIAMLEQVNPVETPLSRSNDSPENFQILIISAIVIVHGHFT